MTKRKHRYYATSPETNPEALYEALTDDAQFPTRFHDFWWGAAKLNTRTGYKTIIIGPALSEEEINNICLGRGADDFETFQAPTRNNHRAGSFYKAMLLKQGKKFEQAIQRVRHKGKDIGVQ